MVIVSYDAAVTTSGGAGQLRKVTKQCQNYGERVQYSVFECIVDPAQWIVFKNKLESVIDNPPSDNLRCII